jgi:hypothetical protein
VSGLVEEPSRGQSDIWIFSIRPSDGVITWQKRIGGSKGDFSLAIYENASSFKVLSNTNSPVSGDKTVNTFANSFDLWIFDLETTVGVIQITEDALEVYPNPSNGVFHLKNFKEKEILVYDSKGTVLVNGVFSDILDLTFLSDGVYFLSYTNQEEESKVIRVIKQ